MVDYTRATGSAGTLIIRDDGTNIRFLIRCNDSATNIGSPGATWSGAAGGARSGRFTWAPGGGERLIAGPFPVTTSQTVSFGIGATGTSGLGGPTSFSQAIKRALPGAPSGLAITRVSDSQQRLNWTRNATYTSVVIQRTYSTGVSWSGWQQVGVASGNAYTFTDTTTAPNRYYVYRVAGRTAAGQSAWSGQSDIYTMPAAPTGIKAERSGNDIVVTAAGTPPFATSYDVMDGATVVGTSVALPWTHANPNAAVPHTYTVRAKVGSLAGAYSTPSNTVQLLTPPNAPTGLTPNGGVRASDGPVRFAWTHNPVDSSTQSAYELRYRETGATAWTTLTGTTAAFRDVELAEGAWQWEARTKGSHPDFSPWSTTATVTVIARPGVAVTQPDTEWDASVLPVVWSWFQAQSRPQSGWEAQLVNADGDTVETRSGSGAATTTTFSRRVAEGEWTVLVRAATGEVWSEWASQTFTVVFDPPAPPSIGGVWDEMQGGIEITVSPSEDPAAVPTVAVLVERSVDDGQTWELVVEVTEDAILLDWESLSYGVTHYRATAVTAEGATAVAEVDVDARSGVLWLSGGAGFGVTARLPYDPGVQITAGRERTLKRYAGRTHPVALTGQALSRTVGISGRTFDRDEATAGVEELVRIAQLETELFLFRDPDGRRIYGAIGDIQLPRQSSTPHPDGWEGVWGYSLTLTEATR